MGSRGSDSADRGLGWLLRAHYDGLAREPLPERWLELIRCLDENERLRLKAELNVEDDERLLRN
jgi:hypothetical protein